MKILPKHILSCTVFVIMSIFFSALFCLGIVGLFLPLPTGVWLPGSKFAALVVGCIGIVISVYNCVRILRDENIFYIPSERHQYYEPNFDTSKTLTIAPLHDIEKKTLVMRVRWRPQPKLTPHVTSFRLFLKRPAEPTAAFKIQFIGKIDNKPILIDQQVLEQKIDLSPPVQGAGQDSVYEDWRELSFKTKDNFPEYKFRIKIDVNNDYADKIEENATQRIWVDMFVALKLSEVREHKKRRTRYSISNINNCLFSVTDGGSKLKL